jgi:hypothetical protein
MLLTFGISQSPGVTSTQLQTLQATVDRYTNSFRKLTPGGGNYPNEASFSDAY